jgi:hypothetical protein
LAIFTVGLFEQDTGNTIQSELAELGGYVTAKCLWNPNCNADRFVRELLDAYYGPSVVPIRSYIDLLREHIDHENAHMGCFADTNSPHLSNELLTKANALWQQAETLAAGDKGVLQRVRLSRLSVDYPILERARLQAYLRLAPDAKFRALAVERFQPFCDVLWTSRIIRFNEGE